MTRQGKFAFPAELPELVKILAYALVLVQGYPERKVLIRPAEYAPVGTGHHLTGSAARSGH